MSLDAVVMAAGIGSRLRPLTERFAKPVLPIEGRPVVVSLLHELRAAGFERATVVTGHLAEQVERLLDGFPLELRFVRQPEPLGSADAVRRAEPSAPALVVAADTLFAAGDVARFVAASGGADGAIAVRATPAVRGQTRIAVREGRVVRVVDPESETSAAPLWLVGEPILPELERVGGPPFELAAAFQRAIDAGARVEAVPIGGTRDLTFPLDLVVENFPYLRGVE